jgi:hypothetical protein
MRGAFVMLHYLTPGATSGLSLKGILELSDIVFFVWEGKFL